MASGNIYRALQRNDNLKPVTDTIKQSVQANRNRELMNKLVDAMRNVDNMSATPSLNYEPDPMARYKNAGNLVNNSLFDALQTGGDANTINSYGSLLKEKVNLMKPETPKFEQVDPYKDLIKFDASGNSSTVRSAKEKPINFRNTPDWLREEDRIKDENRTSEFNNQKELIKMRGGEERKTAGYKGSIDKTATNKQIDVDIASLRSNAEQGISELQNLQGAIDLPKDPDGVYLTGDKEKPYLSEDEYKAYKTKKQSEYKDKLSKYYNDATQMLYKYDQKTKRDLEGAKTELEKIINGDANQIQTVLQTFKADNPDLSPQELKILELNLLYESMANERPSMKPAIPNKVNEQKTKVKQANTDKPIIKNLKDDNFNNYKWGAEPPKKVQPPKNNKNEGKKEITEDDLGLFELDRLPDESDDELLMRYLREQKNTRR